MKPDAEEYKTLLHPQLRDDLERIARALYSLPVQERHQEVNEKQALIVLTNSALPIYRPLIPRILGAISHIRTARPMVANQFDWIGLSVMQTLATAWKRNDKPELGYIEVTLDTGPLRNIVNE